MATVLMQVDWNLQSLELDIYRGLKGQWTCFCETDGSGTMLASVIVNTVLFTQKKCPEELLEMFL